MSSHVPVEGDDIHLPARLVLSPAAGSFRPLPPSTITAEGEIVTAGQAVGLIENTGGTEEILSRFTGFLMGVFALPGERIRVGQPIAWLHPVEGDG